jgi:hypothetical protein
LYDDFVAYGCYIGRHGIGWVPFPDSYLTPDKSRKPLQVEE